MPKKKQRPGKNRGAVMGPGLLSGEGPKLRCFYTGSGGSPGAPGSASGGKHWWKKLGGVTGRPTGTATGGAGSSHATVTQSDGGDALPVTSTVSDCASACPAKPSKLPAAAAATAAVAINFFIPASLTEGLELPYPSNTRGGGEPCS